jgi:hypothetical protein
VYTVILLGISVQQSVAACVAPYLTECSPLSLAFLREKDTQEKVSRHRKNPLWKHLNDVDYTDKKEKKIFFIYKEIQMGLVAYMVIYEEAVSHIWLCNRSRQNFLMYEENLIFLFISVG